MAHITVLKDEAVAALNAERAGIIVDCTYGSGGHSAAILARLPEQGRLVSLDVDQTALEAHPATDPRHTLVCANFRDLRETLAAHNIEKVDGVVADLGWRSEQFQASNKGFSFSAKEPLVMTFGDPETHLFTAHEVVNEWDEANLADIIYGYGEERAARRIARAIVAAREVAPIETAAQLAEIVAGAVPTFRRRQGIHPATKTFQAIRIAVNDELGALNALLADGFALLAPGGRLAIITFHSLEDRLVKQAFKGYAHDQLGVLVHKKPITPSTAEVAKNPRARSAKLRIIEKL
ncbi:16S rRNA (cytosine(1402)-N(4))-methyltransferase [bacterium]|nr:16S rRNA (cytosine(1402)-N(4))-methyltransferase [bacterium]